MLKLQDLLWSSQFNFYLNIHSSKTDYFSCLIGPSVPPDSFFHFLHTVNINDIQNTTLSWFLSLYRQIKCANNAVSLVVYKISKERAPKVHSHWILEGKRFGETRMCSFSQIWWYYAILRYTEFASKMKWGERTKGQVTLLICTTKEGKVLSLKNHWLRFHRVVFPPLNLLALQSNIHGTSSLVQAVWVGAVPKSLVFLGALVRWVLCTAQRTGRATWAWPFSHWRRPCTQGLHCPGTA